jgi:ribosomal-protein-alanine N-acetyltransferase
MKLMPTEQYAIRPMMVKDIVLVSTLATLTMPYPWSETVFYDCLKSEYESRVLIKDGLILGFVVLLMRAGECHLMNIAVHPSYQGHGYGKKLLSCALQVAEERKACQILLEVRKSNDSAIKLYEDSGFSEVGVRPDYYPGDHGREDAVIMSLFVV